MMVPIRNKNLKEEAKEILDYFDGNKVEIHKMFEGQFQVLYQRSQTLISLAGIVITVTGFSGKIIAQTSFLSRVLIVVGLFFVLLSGMLAIWGIIRIRFITQWYEPDIHSFIFHLLENRNRKTQYFILSMISLIFGFTLYVISISMMLMLT
jgi:hypothetical protein